MKLRSLLLKVSILSSILLSLLLSPAQAVDESTGQSLGIKALTSTLDVSNFKLDNDPNDFDIFTYILLDVLGSKPKSAAWALSEGEVALTAFVPTDQAFRLWVKSITGKNYVRERDVYRVIFNLGFKNMEQVLLYHVVLGSPFNSAEVLAKSGEFLTTAQGSTIRIWLNGNSLRIRDKDLKRSNPEVILDRVDLNLGNRQIAHPINGVLTPKI